MLALRTFLLTLFLLALALAPAPAPAQEPADPQVESLLGQMTLEEKIGQMTLFTGDWDVTGPSLRASYREDIRAGRVGALLNVYTPEMTRELQRIAVEETRLKIPLLFGYDVIHGHRTIFPIPLGEACSWDLAMMQQDARIAAAEAAADGLHWTYAPMVDVARDPRWGRIAEGAGEDTWLGMQIARARVAGFQHHDLSAADSLIACAKHYAGYGAAIGGRDYNTVDMSRRELWNTYLPPFKAAVNEGVGSFMTAFNEVDGVPCTANAYLLDEVLRRKWAFQGFVVTDYTSMNEMIAHGYSSDERQAGEQAALAGVDMDMMGSIYLNHLPGLVRSGKVPIERVNDAVRRILQMKAAKGLFKDPYRNCDPARARETLMKPEHLQASQDAARRSMVLLKNRGVLPLKKNGLKLALVGPLADDRANLIGCWSAAGDGKKAVSVRQGILDKGYAVQMTVAKGCDFERGDRSGFAAALKAARQADVVVAVMGESAGMSGEAASRTSLDLPGVQKELLAQLKTTGKPVVLVVMNGRPLTLSWEDEHLDAILEAWFPGSMGGPAVADVLFGDYNPAGRLVVSFPRTLGQVPNYYNHKNTGRPFNGDPEVKYASRYLDVGNDPLYPFGYGLSYTKFEYSPLTLSASEISPKDVLNVTVTVKNAGPADGEEVVQLYLRDLVGSVTRPVRELRGFEKVMLKAGESRTLTFRLGARELAFYRQDMSYGVEAGDFKVWVGPDSARGSEAGFRLTGSAPVPEP